MLFQEFNSRLPAVGLEYGVTQFFRGKNRELSRGWIVIDDKQGLLWIAERKVGVFRGGRDCEISQETMLPLDCLTKPWTWESPRPCGRI
jgi:hypothetical protein